MPPPTHSHRIHLSVYLALIPEGQDGQLGAWLAQPRVQKWKSPRVRALSHSLASVSVVFVLFRNIPAGRGVSGGNSTGVFSGATSRVPEPRRIAGVGCGQCARLHRHSGEWSLWRGRAVTLWCGVPSKPAITAAAAKTPGRRSGSGVSSAPYPNTAGPTWQPQGAPGVGRDQQPFMAPAGSAS